MTHYSQYGQDALIGDVPFRNKSGIFVDVGARDGTTISNTHYLEYECGWNGIAVEPHPDMYSELVRTRQCKCMNIAVSDRPSSGVPFVKFLEEPFGHSGLLSTFGSTDRLDRVQHEIIQVPTEPLSTLLSPFKEVQSLDVDVEGHELPVLQRIDFTRVRIDIIGVGTDPNTKQGMLIDAFRRSNGYRPFLQLVSDRFYALGSDAPSVTEFTRPIQPNHRVLSSNHDI